ncbi:chromo domain-containing protein 1 [Emericellopsis cladophorae]|uniref:Chromo domain-containing protein 1 n=1 Tax=Emericellopsis cladophorae TaxID=2686198 RepID=A0A9P9Y0I4_9HYPO|nr:chromo domain-containing protein 1 [Emericellopsis cladophorae]KAI6780704.1 chromo domain-containing protein 1 [Emericellopsis cladophorae]
MSREEDEVSLTSSIEENPESDTEWEIEGIIGDALLAERDDNDRPLTRHRCLVLWTGFPLAEATWEPIENLPEETVAEWETCKRKIEDEGGDPKESISKWVREQERKIGSRYKRHKLRNKLRTRHGLNPKPWTVAGGQLPKELSDEMRRFYLQEALSIWSPSEFESNNFDSLNTPKARPPQPTASTQSKVNDDDDDRNNNTASNGSMSREARPPGTSPARKLSNAKQTVQDSEEPRPTGLKRLSTLPGAAKKPEPRKAEPMAPVGNVFSGGKRNVSISISNIYFTKHPEMRRTETPDAGQKFPKCLTPFCLGRAPATTTDLKSPLLIPPRILSLNPVQVPSNRLQRILQMLLILPTVFDHR